METKNETKREMKQVERYLEVIAFSHMLLVVLGCIITIKIIAG